MDGHLQALRSLCNPRHALLFVRIAVFAAFVPLLMRLPPLRLDELLASRGARSLDPDAAQRIMRYVRLALAWGWPIIRPSCMTRGLTLFYFLRRSVADLALCFGVAELEGKVTGHCWLVRDGEPFLEPQDPRAWFTEIYRFPLKRRASMAAGGPAAERVPAR